ncbi:glycerophosphoryl diester phosphodiesterase [Sphingomonas sp. PP-CE-3A-406]|uniref:glycerophosphodiester phosphodiesterase family protein n=1 Tax=Sphingomonas sp. PP-CE-3A-406 TaxID=2135659 RepID=UPI000EF94298|nr:glycerophosphodiester phosphodiesterase family protein [Sphingomonas sp. PP-CE-3A-406]RMB54932.1 glycerophosphoryl diester phosphodiesterase [Sphingomonas sp. PP-CE-3A-406]
MTRSHLGALALLTLAALPAVSIAASVQPLTAREIHAALADTNGRLLIAAHRGCHNPAPGHDLPSAPENSLKGLDHCVAMGIDIMETDVRRSRDGYLVMIHDATVDRTTNGTGAVDHLTLAEIKAFRLRDDEGQKGAGLTDQQVPTLDEILAHAGNRIVLNLDIKDAIYAEVIEAVVRAGATDRVIVKTVAGIGSAPLAAMAPYDRVSFMPILSSGDAAGADLAGIVTRQASGRRRAIGVELPRMPAAALPGVVAAARAAHERVWVNTLWEGFIDGYGGDVDALRDPDAVWGRLQRAGISIIQTDEPEALRRYLRR